MLDICLTLHAEHGGGNNSTFTTHVVTSSGTDTYSCMAAALASLKGPKHGGANIKVIRMFEDMKEQVKDWKDEDEVRHYLQALLDKQAFDRAGLIYGMGHAVYSLSDPVPTCSTPLWRSCPGRRAVRRSMSCTPWWSGWAPRSSPGSGRCIRRIRQCGPFIPVLSTHMLDLPWSSIPPSLPWPGWLGWSAHRIEELINMGKIIRAYKYVGNHGGLCAACGAVTSNPSERSVFGDEVYTGKGRA